MAERAEHDAEQHDERCDLRRRAHERGDRGRGALVDVGRPHVERDCGQLERKSRDDERDADCQPCGNTSRIHDRLRNTREVHRPREAIGQRYAIQEQARRQRAQDEVLQACFRRTYVVPRKRRQHVDGQRLKLQAHIQRHQVVGRRHDHHAHGAEQHQHRKLEPGDTLTRIVVEREHDAQYRAGENQQLRVS